jgi:hypothetical protein
LKSSEFRSPEGGLLFLLNSDEFQRRMLRKCEGRNSRSRIWNENNKIKKWKELTTKIIFYRKQKLPPFCGWISLD